MLRIMKQECDKMVMKRDNKYLRTDTLIKFWRMWMHWTGQSKSWKWEFSLHDHFSYFCLIIYNMTPRFFDSKNCAHNSQTEWKSLFFFKHIQKWVVQGNCLSWSTCDTISILKTKSRSFSRFRLVHIRKM